MRRIAVLFSLTILSAFNMPLLAQIWDKMFHDEYRIDTTDIKALKVELNALAFFRDNEYDSQITRGYSLPGTWLQPKLTYNPITPIHLELGLHGLILDGANKYPNYAYHDIATWKGNQYTSGVHLLPWFRAQADLRHRHLAAHGHRGRPRRPPRHDGRSGNRQAADGPLQLHDSRAFESALPD